MKGIVGIGIGLLLCAGIALAQGAPMHPGEAAPPVEAAQLPAPKPPQPPPDLGKWWKNSAIAKELELTDAQVAQIEQTFLEHRLKLIDLRAEVERQEARLQPLIEADQPDEAKVSAQLDALLAARGRLEKAQAMMMLAIRKVLSVEQWKRLEAIKEQRMRPPRPPIPPGQQPKPPLQPPAGPQRPPEDESAR